MKVFYTKKQSTDKNESFSPSAGKPAKAIATWKALGLPIEIVEPSAASAQNFLSAHKSNYVKGVLDCSLPNGFGNTSREVARTLPFTTGSLIAATRYAFKTKEPACSPTSGFHHAGHESGGGFCTFNGLIMAAQAAKSDGAKRVGILDIDMHFGDGTDAIIKKLKLDFISHWTFGGNAITTENAERWLSELPGIIKKEFTGCDVLIYQAGADPAVSDPLGGVLTVDQLRRRDKIVFEMCQKLKIPVAWNFAGGYQDPIERVIEIHTNTARECIRAYEEKKGKASNQG